MLSKHLLKPSRHELGKALLTGAFTMAAAQIALMLLPNLPLHGTLFIAIIVGGSIFLLSNAALHWHGTRGALRQLRLPD